MKGVLLSNGLVAIVDDADFDLVAGTRWYGAPGANTFYAVNRNVREHGKQTTLYMHRLILGLGRFVMGGPEVDHLNRNGLDNRRSNLRVVTHRENAQNRDNGRLPDMTCPTCGATFTPGKRSRRYCSLSCSRRRPDHPRSRRILPDLVCPSCLVTFRPHNHTTRYCSHACSNAAVWARRRAS